MPKTPFIIAAILLTASASPVLARGGQGGPIGPGSRDGLTPRMSDSRPMMFTDGYQPAVKRRFKPIQRK